MIFKLIPKNIKSFNKVILGAFFLIWISTFFALYALAGTDIYQPSQVFVTNIDISDQKEFESGQIIEGVFQIKNSEDNYVGNLNYQVYLLSKYQNGQEQLSLIDIFTSTEVFSLGANEKVNLNFSYDLPKNLITGDYIFRIGLISNKGEKLGWQDKEIKIKGNEQFLFIERATIIYKGEELALQAGPGFEKDETPKVKMFLVNSGAKALTVYPEVIVNKRMENMEEIGQWQEKEITLQPNQKEMVVIELPQIDQPDVYLASIKYYNLIDKQPISRLIQARWIVKGASAKVASIKPDKDFYQKGETAKISIDLIGSADLGAYPPTSQGTIIENAKLSVEIRDSQWELCGSQEQVIDQLIDTKSLALNVPITKKCADPQIKAQLTSDGDLLDENLIQIPTQELSPEKKTPESSTSYLWIIILLILILAIIGFMFYFKKKKVNNVSKKLPLLLLMFFVLGFLVFFFADVDVVKAQYCGTCISKDCGDACGAACARVCQNDGGGGLCVLKKIGGLNCNCDSVCVSDNCCNGKCCTLNQVCDGSDCVVPECNVDTDCTDYGAGSKCTIDKCYEGGTAGAYCTNTDRSCTDCCGASNNRDCCDGGCCSIGKVCNGSSCIVDDESATGNISHSPNSGITTETNVTITAGVTDNDNIGTIQIYVGGALKKTCNPPGTPSSASCSYSKVFSEGTYSYYAKVIDVNDNSTTINGNSFSVIVPVGSVSAPTNVSAAATECDKINLTWQDNSSNESGFKIYRQRCGPLGGGCNSFSLVVSLSANTTNHTFASLDLNSVYKFYVEAWATGKTSGQSETVQAHTWPFCGAFPALITYCLAKGFVPGSHSVTSGMWSVPPYVDQSKNYYSTRQNISISGLNISTTCLNTVFAFQNKLIYWPITESLPSLPSTWQGWVDWLDDVDSRFGILHLSEQLVWLWFEPPEEGVTGVFSGNIHLAKSGDYFAEPIVTSIEIFPTYCTLAIFPMLTTPREIHVLEPKLVGRGPSQSDPFTLNEMTPAEIVVIGKDENAGLKAFWAEAGQGNTIPSAEPTPQDVSNSAVWTSADPSIAVVSSPMVTGVSEGNTTITADFEGFSAVIPITVNSGGSPVCGNHIKEGAEDCDFEDLGSCTSCDMEITIDSEKCVCAEYCGDGNIQKPNDFNNDEQCEPPSSISCGTDNCGEKNCQSDCQWGNCLLASGNDCFDNSDCSAGKVCQSCQCVVPVVPTHAECVGMTCQSIAGAGSNQCSIDDDCRYLACNDSDQCVYHTGIGMNDTCTVDSDCVVVEPTLSVSLSSDPFSGQKPLNNVDLIASAISTTGETINYKFDCQTENGDCMADGDYSDCDLEADNQVSTTYKATNLCDYSSAGTYTAKVLIQSSTLSAIDTVTIAIINPGPGNNPPIADAGNDQSVDKGTLVHLNGLGSFDPDAGDSIASYQWSIIANPGGNSLSNASVFNPTFTPTAAGTYTIGLEVEDTFGAKSNLDIVDVVVTNPAGPSNAPPNADARVNPLICYAGIPCALNLDGCLSTDDGLIVSYEWDINENDNNDETYIPPVCSGTYNYTYPIMEADYNVGIKLRVTDNGLPPISRTAIATVGIRHCGNNIKESFEKCEQDSDCLGSNDTCNAGCVCVSTSPGGYWDWWEDIPWF